MRSPRDGLAQTARLKKLGLLKPAHQPTPAPEDLALSGSRLRLSSLQRAALRAENSILACIPWSNASAEAVDIPELPSDLRAHALDFHPDDVGVRPQLSN